MSIVVLTGAGISAESGVATFRDSGGLWEGHAVDAVATPEGFAADPELVQRFYDARRRALAAVEPNAAHRALARLEQEHDDDVLLVTQNVDDLHERAGSRRVLHMHGELRRARCVACGTRSPWHEDLLPGPPCPACGEPALRPDVVWFGEVPYDLDEIFTALAQCTTFVAVGTSGAVYPAAGFVMMATNAGAHTVELNLAASEMTSRFEDVRDGPASVLVPQWVDEVLGRA
ncbi:NAD-dependent deacylase [Georgenia sp. MJ173]|uniref:NAD-dependent deacylase n=1 Tax=Georgenia sunbinii TaxID=3117728 RepID=UPI002F267152